MKVELHILQNFAPSNLNRDDTGSPKDCELGGVRRARVSSQCFKRAIRQAFVAHKLLDKGGLGTRTKRIVEALAKRLVEEKKVGEATATGVAKSVLVGIGLGVVEKDDTQKTEYLLYLPSRQIDVLASAIAKHWDVLAGPAMKPVATPAADGKKPKESTKAKAQKDAASALSKDVRDELSAAMWGKRRSPDLALFGRMIADKPDHNVDAACQVAHAISTNRVTMDFDFYTAVDDLKPGDTAGADMMGTIPFNSSCFYRYAVIDIDDLAKNLGGPEAAKDAEIQDLAKTTVGAFIRASVVAIPTGKQNSMAAQNRPSLVLAIVRDGGAPWSLANAFVKPVRPSEKTDLVRGSMDALDAHLGATANMYGTKGIKDAPWCALADGIEAPPHLSGKMASKETPGSALPGLTRDVRTIDALVAAVTAAAFGA
jgi:CRISPR system Cascade subunit CasC